TAFLLPMVATPVAVGLVWRLIYEPSIGIANQICMWLGVGRQPWLGALDMALWALLIVDIWQWTPMVMLVVLAGATALPLDVLESAQVDGAGKWQLVRNIILPLLRPAILTALLLRMIDILKTFDLIYSTTQGGPGYATETLNILSYREAFEYFKFGRASATLVVFFLTVFLIAIVFIKFKNKVEVEY
ncbi:MAG: sugar ABC transporter permease, partial [Lachnospiraceae bacterium]|nr:sugar ABC transporter permease [Lachnospiraceae bacterium]